MNLHTLLSDTLAGHRLTPEEGAFLLSVTGRDLHHLFAAADEMREKKVGNTVTFVRNQNVHITNICKNLCGFCGFGRKKNDSDAYLFGKDEVQAQVREAKARGVTEICFLSGVHPDFRLKNYLSFLEWAHEVFPDVHIHAYSPDEVDWIARKDNLTPAEVITSLKDGGLGSLQGTAAEVLVDEVRDVICPAKVRTARWEEIIREAHKLGLSSSATIMYGSTETPDERAAHLDLIRGIQDDTGGFSEMVLLSYIHSRTPLHQKGTIRFGPTGRDDLVTTAVCRLYLDNINHIQVSWPKIGIKMSQLGLLAGADDLSGTMYIDDVTGDAGADLSDIFEPEEMAHICADIGRELKERSTLYKILK
ncbi:5-amino-6-(D-ribitylamino)uracil--L-tyrosine 4-hydroxyphenyl transferase CofH [Methanospirillum lacunae]|uniref:7,8-didemethyl-8-hydroxy-5-deazariboflavin synthase subunit CofH n=1 Tax=Methanospirillum lacunae TaxID=668570 RepID=A0A2V2N146_9EURY|nr:5-amino-6-(D-ribitylamino)uracil--L-tyrosine 4-hydroxyphenyl transferase CofH [Methanospirillum lacunae]PWR72285.1 7,8-didemethyl-8-hydroxy-5-deazariboflavin synthase subunit CofH [Methanospirillum lacunae]